MHINGTVYSDTFWLRISDMFVNTSIAMIIMAGETVIFCGWRTRQLPSKAGTPDPATPAARSPTQSAVHAGYLFHPTHSLPSHHLHGY